MSFDNSVAIEQLKEKCKTIERSEDKSEAYRKIAVWYSEMGEETNALEYHRLSYKEYKQNYLNLKSLILAELSYGNPEEAKEYALTLFSMDPTNPTVMQNLIELYQCNESSVHFSKVINALISEFSGSEEALGNIKVHYGIYLHEKNETEKAIQYLQSAKENFEIAFRGNHYVIEQIKDYLKQLA